MSSLHWISTYSGKRFFLDEISPDLILIDDIAHALSNICRYTGHMSFYSVADHCINMSRLTPSNLAYTALMHDAAEAYIGDISHPLKQLIFSSGETVLRDTIAHVEQAIASKFNTIYPLPDEIRSLDKIIRIQEALQWQPECVYNIDKWDGYIDYAKHSPFACYRSISPSISRTTFLSLFDKLNADAVRGR